MSTGEGWDDLVTIISRDSATMGNDCIENPTFTDFVSAGNKPVGCGNWLLISLFYGIYVAIVQIIFLNLFMAIILNGYFVARDEASQDLNE
jgi:hypothetical protein